MLDAGAIRVSDEDAVAGDAEPAPVAGAVESPPRHAPVAGSRSEGMTGTQ